MNVLQRRQVSPLDWGPTVADFQEPAMELTDRCATAPGEFFFLGGGCGSRGGSVFCSSSFFLELFCFFY